MTIINCRVTYTSRILRFVQSVTCDAVRRVGCTAGWLRMSPELLEQIYGHHHPDYQLDVTARMSGQDRDRGREQTSIFRTE
jgi:hypothetical protein